MNKIAKNLLIDQTCWNCRYAKYNFYHAKIICCINNLTLKIQKQAPIEQTCLSWETE